MSKTDEQRDSETIDQAIHFLKQTPEFKSLTEKLKPLVESILSSSEREGKFRDFLKQSSDRLKKSGTRMRLLKEDSKAEYDSPLNTLRKAFLYLALYETSLTNMLDFVVMLLVFNGHDFIIARTKKRVQSLDDLDESYVAEKMGFLKKHNFSFFTENINKTIRNKIAHMDFDVEGKGVVILNQERIDLQTETIRLEAILLLAAAALGSFGLGNLLDEDT